MLDMYTTQENWSKNDMLIFHALATNFYDLSGRKYFLDIGANIGTTSIYFQKKIDNDTTIIAFEPDPETYKILRTNFVLNDMPENSVLENYGLSDVEDDMMLNRSWYNPGANSLLTRHDNGEVPVHLVSLDNYLESKKINLDEIKYIWIDTEGFEAQVFGGMKKLISNQSIPIFFEWNPDCYMRNETFDGFVKLLADNFWGIY